MSHSRIGILAALVVSLALAGCGGGAGNSVSPSIAPQAHSGTLAPAAQSRTASDRESDGRARVVAHLRLAVDGTGAHFAVGDWDDVFYSKTDVNAPIPSFQLVCERGNNGWGWGWGTNWSEDESCHKFGDGNGDKDDQGVYYVRMTPLQWGAQDFAVAGPGQSIAAGTVAFPASDAPLQLKARTIYIVELVKMRGSVSSPTPAPTPTPIPVTPGGQA